MRLSVNSVTDMEIEASWKKERENNADITKEVREFFEKYLEEHPLKTNDNLELDEFNDDRFNYDHEQACARLVKRFLAGEIK